MKAKRIILFTLVLLTIFTSLAVYADQTTINLYGAAGSGDPQNVKVVGDLGVKFDVPAGKKLVKFTLSGSPTWVKTDTEAELVLFRWNTDYATTVAGTKLETYREHHADNTDFNLVVSGNYGEGTYLVLLAASTATNDVGTWTHVYDKSVNATTFVNGTKHDNMARSYIVVTDATAAATMDASSILALTFVALTASVILFKKRKEAYN